MIRGTRNLYPVFFAAWLLVFTCLIRSRLLVDTTFLPRFISLAILLLIAWVAGISKEWRHTSWFEGMFLLFYLWNLLSSFWSVSVPEALMQSQMVFLSFAVYLLISGFSRKYSNFENIFIRTLLIVLLFSFGLVFYKMSTLEFFDPYKIIALSANNNLYAGFLLLSLPLALAGYSRNRGFWRYFSGVVVSLILFCIVIIQSRAVYLGLLAGILIASALILTRYREVITKRNVLTGTLVIMLSATLFIFFYTSLDTTRRHYFLSKIPVWNYVRKYANERSDTLLIRRNTVKAANTEKGEFDFAETYYENANLRIIFWKKSTGLFLQHPIVGVGAGNWRLAIPSCKEPPNPEHTFRNFTYSQPHNEWIGIITELGIVGFLLAACIFFVPLAIVLRRILSAKPPPAVPTVFYLSFILGFYLFAFFDFPLKRVEHNVLLFGIFAFLFRKIPGLQGASMLFFHREDAKTQRKWLMIPLVLALSILLAATRIHGEYYTLKMFANEGKNYDAVVAFAGKAESPWYTVTPNTLPVAWFEGVARFRKGNANDAVDCFQRALKSTPYEVRVLNDYAAAQFSLQRTAQAKEALYRALGIDPFFDDARFNLGAIYYLTGQRDSALFHVGKCRNCTKKTDFLQEMQPQQGYPQ